MAVTEPPVSANKARLLGEIRPLPLRVAAEVAWKSIKVRLSRSLVTVSSVVLAVAFLLSVLGGEIGSAAVYRSFSADQQSIDDAVVFNAMAERQRSRRDWLQSLAEPQTRAAVVAYAAAAGAPAIDAAAAAPAFWLDLVEWLEELKAIDRFKIIGSQTPVAWLADLQQAETRQQFFAIAAQLRGVRLPVDADTVSAQAKSSLPQLLAALSTLQGLEPARLQRLAAAGGASELRAGLRDGRIAEPEGLAEAGLPLHLALPGLDRDRLQGLRQQLQIDALRGQAHEVLLAINRDFSTGRRLDLQHLVEPDGDPRLPLLKQELQKALGESELQALLDRLASGKRIAKDEAMAKVRAAADVVLEKFNAQFSGRAPIRLAQLTDNSLAGDARGPLLERALQQQLGAEGIAAVRAELQRRKRLQNLQDSLNAAAFDPEGSGEKTFWLLVLSLAVCIVGIVNSMMMAVTERFREIATMKCLGALDSFIMKAFLIESSSVGLVGAVLGGVLGLIVVLIQASARYGGTFWNSLPLGPLLLASLAALACGLVLTIIGALLPAYKAARMHPIEAMRLEA